MPRVLIAGCGYVGSAAAELFLRSGWKVEGWTSSAASAERLPRAVYPVKAVDITDPMAVARNAGDADLVVQCASSRGGTPDDYRRIYLDGARNLAAAFPGALSVFTSSTSVYAQTDGEWVDETSAADPQQETGRTLREAEEVVLESGGVVARVAGIFGPGRSAILRRFLSGEAVIDRGSERFVNQVHRDDIASALLLLVQQSRGKLSSNRSGIFNVSDHHPLTLRQCYEFLSQHLQRPLPPVKDATLPRKRGNTNKRVSSEKIQRLGWVPRYPNFASAMTESILPNLARCGV